jgi:hypothetical protein
MVGGMVTAPLLSMLVMPAAVSAAPAEIPGWACHCVPAGVRGCLVKGYCAQCPLFAVAVIQALDLERLRSV